MSSTVLDVHTDMATTPGTLPINGEQLKGRWLVADWTGPGGLLLVHLQEEDRVETLQVRTGEHPARHPQTHLYQLRRDKHSWCKLTD